MKFSFILDPGCAEDHNYLRKFPFQGHLMIGLFEDRIDEPPLTRGPHFKSWSPELASGGQFVKPPKSQARW